MKICHFFLSFPLAFVLFTSCSQPESAGVKSGKLSVKIPFNRSLIDNQGRSLNVRITGFDGKIITFVRRSDNRKFQLPLSRLSLEEQEFFSSAVIQGGESDFQRVKGNSLDAVKKEAEKRRNIQVQKELEELNEELDRYEIGTMKWRSIMREINNLKRESGLNYTPGVN